MRKLTITASPVADLKALSQQHPFSFSARAVNDVAEIRISGAIARDANSAELFKQQIDALVAQGIKNVKLFLNTPGGSVFEANEIANEIQRFDGVISGYGGALVASAGTYLALICNSFEMPENGQYMYHKPAAQLSGNEDRIKSDMQLLTNLTNQYRTAYAKKNRA